MKYELETVIGVEKHPGESLDLAVSLLRDAVAEVLDHPEYAAVVQFRVTPGNESDEIIVGLRFDGMTAQYVEEAADEILQAAIAIAQGSKPSPEQRAYREESVSLQPVPA